MDSLPAEPRLVSDVLAQLGVDLDVAQIPARISSEEFETLTTAEAVLKHATEIFNLLETACHADAAIRCTLGWRVFERRDDGAEHKHAFAVAHARGVATAMAFASVTVNRGISEEERAAQEAKQREAEHQARVKQHATRVIAALKSPAVARVQRLLQSDPALTVHTMNAVAEIIQHDLRGEFGVLRAQNQFTRFDRSINHPNTLGEHARHAIPKGEPHPKPMNVPEAQGFIRDLAESWYKLRAESSA